MRLDQAHAYVESLLERLTRTDKVLPDHDGDYPIHLGNTTYYVRIVDDTSPVVQVFGVALADVESTPELAQTLNDYNCRIRFARVFHVQRQVLVETDILAESLDPAGFFNACDCVGSLSARYGPLLQQRFGGTLVTNPTAPADGRGPEPTVGLYL